MPSCIVAPCESNRVISWTFWDNGGRFNRNKRTTERHSGTQTMRRQDTISLPRQNPPILVGRLRNNNGTTTVYPPNSEILYSPNHTNQQLCVYWIVSMSSVCGLAVLEIVARTFRNDLCGLWLVCLYCMLLRMPLGF